MSKNYFGLLDSRNTKYQGVIRNDHFDGIGILIDDELTTVLSTWKKYTINGPSVIIFSSLQIFFGQLDKGSPQGVVCLQLNQKQKILIRFQKDNNSSQSVPALVALISSNQQITYIEKNKDKDQYQIIHNFCSKNEDEILKNLSRTFGKQVKKQQINLELYLKTNFVDQMEVFQLSGAKQLFFGFKGTNSLGFKLQNNLPIAMGFWNLFPRNLIFGRKVSYNLTFPEKTKIQQGNFESSQEIFTWTKSKGPSVECIKSAEEYFKKSTTFRNEFIKLDQVKNLFSKLKQVQQKVRVETSKKYGQTLLQNNYGSSQDRNQQVIPKEYTLQQVKEEIYKAAAKKHPSFKSSYRSPFQSSFKKQSKYSYEDTNRSRGTYRDQYRVNQFNLSHQTRDPFEKSIYKEDTFQTEMTTRYIKDTTYNKVDLLKNVDQIIKKEKQTEQILLNQLMKKDQLYDRSGQKSPFRQNEEYVSPITKRYRKYEPKTGTNEKQIKYEIKTSPFMVQLNKAQNRSETRANPIRKIKYLDAEKENRLEPQFQRYSKYTIGRTQTGKERGKRQNVINNSVNQSQQWQSKSHSNLAKYKQRLKESSPAKQTGNNRRNRYSYLNQNPKQGEEQIRSSEKLMNQLKLFDIQSQNKSKLLRSYTDNNNFSPHKERLAYMPSEPRQKLRTTNPSNDDNNSGYAKRRTYNYDPRPEQSKKDETHTNDQHRLTKMFSFQDRTLSDKINQNPQILQSHKKVKRTFHYVQ